MWYDYVLEKFANQSIGFDPMMLNAGDPYFSITWSIDLTEKRRDLLAKGNVKLIEIEENLVDLLWKDKHEDIKPVKISTSLSFTGLHSWKLMDKANSCRKD